MCTDKLLKWELIPNCYLFIFFLYLSVLFRHPDRCLRFPNYSGTQWHSLRGAQTFDKLHSNISFQKSQPDCTNKSASLSWADSHCFPLAELDCQLHHSAEASIHDEGGHAPDSVNTDAVLPQLSCKVTATFTAPGQTQRSCKLFRHKKR